VNLTKGPEDIVLVLARSLDLELRSEVLIDWQAVSQSVEQLSLGQWSRLVQVHVIGNVRLCSSYRAVFEESELGNEILVALVMVWTDAVLTILVSVVLHRQFGEIARLQLVGAVEGTSEDGSLYRESHPSFSKQRVGKSGLFLHGTNFVCGKCSNGRVKTKLRCLVLLDLKHL